MYNKILVIDDEKAIADIIKFNLEKEGHSVETAYDGEEAINLIHKIMPDLVILDVMMPKKDGFQVLKEIRIDYNFPVIMLTAKEEEVDKVLGLELGADDYITKPFSMRELIARVKANLRRVDYSNAAATKDLGTMITSDDLTIDLNKYEVKKDGCIVDLTLREYELLKFLASSSNQVFSREQLLEEVWGYEYYGDIRTVDVTIRRLREKIEDNSGDFKYILTKRGVGYYFRRT
ncbi:response regulator transcription factor [Tissierella pigra]|uniref:Response regulator transcription factor n=1 Tax=Tissierella pigra TaxID=2607614 RepID=A0A6N7XYA5_9FIRM|nr:response regulator [Tissierella pigra]MBU5424783.1 response regulator transcription factor [Tissierella pigra]MSU02797.1 response regulator transcription factor [Tissierella pigra]